MLQKPIVKFLENNELNKAIEILPTSVNEAVGGTPISMLMQVVNPVKIEATLAIMLTRLMAMVNVDERLNLQSHQIPFIAKQLIQNFKHENMADFNACFHRGSCGFYGQIYRLDGAVIVDWMQKYLEEKYQVIENKLMQEKENPYEIRNTQGNGKGLLELLIEATGYDGKEVVDNNSKENEIQRKKLTDNRKAYTVGKIGGVYAKSQEHAVEIVKKLISNGELPEDVL